LTYYRIWDGISGRTRLSDVIEDLILTATGKLKADLVIKGGNLVNVYTGEIIDNCDVAIKHDRIALIGEADHTIGVKTKVLHANGKYLVPGLLDGHIHIESSMMTVTEFSRVVVPRGTAGVFIDPHEIANVLGFNGIKLIIEEAKRLPLKVFICAPSCVPAVGGEIETSGSIIGLEEIERLITLDEVIGLAEVMNYPGVINAEEEVLNKIRIALRKGKVVEGHAPSLRGKELCAYIAAGISSCHETTEKKEGLEKLRLGITLMIREGSAWKDLGKVIKVITEDKVDTRNVVLVSDDRHPEDLLREGHVDYLIRRAIEEGVDPIAAIQMVTINVASHYGLTLHIGGIAPPRYADIVIVDQIDKFNIDSVILDGKMVARNGKLLIEIPEFKYPEYAKKTINVKRKLKSDDFRIKVETGDHERRKTKINVIEVFEDSILTKRRIEEMAILNGELMADIDRDIVKVSVIERHRATGNMATGFVKGFGIKSGASAQTIAHDSHNIIVIGVSEKDMAIAANRLIESGGGIAVVRNQETLALIELPIAGLLSDEHVESICAKLSKVKDAWIKLGCTLKNPFMTLSMLALPVIPELRITDKGLIDVKKQKTINLVVEQ